MKYKLIKIIAILAMFTVSLSAFALSTGAIDSLSETETVAETETEIETGSEKEKETFTVNGVEIPKFDFITKPYFDIKDANIPLDKIREAFNIVPEFKYENGKYMVSDIGADSAELYNNTDYEYLKMTLEDGYWVVEISEAEINNPELVWNVYFQSIENKWDFYYHEQVPNRRVQFCTSYNQYSIGVYIDTEDDWVDVTYLALDRPIQDEYRGGLLKEHKVIRMFDDQDDWFSVVYNPDKSVKNVCLWYDPDSTYHYLIPGHGWYSVSEPYQGYEINTPAGYEDKDIEYFTSFAPCVINCAHGNLIPATCEGTAICSACGFVPDGSEALGHDLVTDKAVAPTCTETGLTEGYHCSRCDAMTAPQIEVPELGHNYSDGVCIVCKDVINVEEQSKTEAESKVETESNTETDIQTESNTETNVQTESNTETNVQTESNTETNVQTESKTETDPAKSENSGCGSSIGIGATMVASVCGIALVFVKKKKD